MSETLVMEPTEEMTATQVMPAEGQVAVQTAEQYVELPIADAPEPEQEPSVPETQAEEPAAKVPDAGTDENSNSIDVEIENMVWKLRMLILPKMIICTGSLRKRWQKKSLFMMTIRITATGRTITTGGDR